MPVVDADCHVVESTRTWSYMEEGDARYRPVWTKAEGDMGRRLGTQAWAIDGKLVRPGPVGTETTSQESREMISVDARLAHMDELGVDVQILFPTIFLRPITNDPKIELALTRSYNRWLADIWSKGNGRLRWAVVLPLLSMDESLKELEWAAQNGACAVFVRGFEADRHLGDPYFFPMYEAAAALNLAVCAHAGNSSFWIEQFYWTSGGLPVFKFPVVDGFLSIIHGKVMQQFPTLRYGFIETASQWVPWALHSLGRADQSLGGRDRIRDASLMRENRLYVACQTDDDIPYVVKYAGEDNLVIGSDYGHGDTSSELAALRHLREMEEVEDGVVDKILDANPTALYGL
jgi:uncharacterized protein